MWIVHKLDQLNLISMGNEQPRAHMSFLRMFKKLVVTTIHNATFTRNIYSHGENRIPLGLKLILFFEIY